MLHAALLGLALIGLIGVSVSERARRLRRRHLRLALCHRRLDQPRIAFALVGIGFIVANRANLTNVGGEGQIAVGGIAATAVALYGGMSTACRRSCLLPADARRGGRRAAWGALAGVLKVKAGTNEVISTLLLSFIGIWLLYWCVQSLQSAAQADDQFGDAAGIAGNSRIRPSCRC